MYCKFCGQEIDDNSAFCKFCGEAAVTFSDQPAQKPDQYSSSAGQPPSYGSAAQKEESPLPHPFSEDETASRSYGTGEPDCRTQSGCPATLQTGHSFGGNRCDGRRPDSSPAAGYSSSFSPGFVPPPKENPADKPIYKILLVIICIFQGLFVVGIFLIYISVFTYLIFSAAGDISPDEQSGTPEFYERYPSEDSNENYYYDDFGEGYGDSFPFYDYGYYDFGEDYFGEGEEDYDYYFGEDGDGYYYEMPDYYNFFNQLPYYSTPAPPADTL